MLQHNRVEKKRENGIESNSMTFLYQKKQYLGIFVYISH